MIIGIVSVIILLIGIVTYALLTPTQKKDSITIGVIFPQTGPIAEVGGFLFNGVDLALQEINAHGGVRGAPLNILIEDDQCVPKNTVTALHKLIEVDALQFIIGPFCSGSMLAAAPIAEENRVILFSPGASSPEVTDAGDYIFRTTPSDIHQAQYFSTTLAEKFENVAIIHVENKWATDMTHAFTQSFPNTIVTIQSFENDVTDVRTQLLKIKEQKPDALLIFVYPNHYPFITQQLVTLGIDVPLFATHTFETSVAFQLGENAQRYTYTNLDYPEENSDIAAFKNKFFTKYDEEPSIWVALAYDTTLILGEALNACGEDSDCVKDYLYAVQGYTGVSGVKSFNENGDITDPYYVLKTVSDGKFVRIQ